MSSRLVLRKSFIVFLVALMTIVATTSTASSPEAGAKGRYRAECRRLTKQINHYEGTVMPMAMQRGNAAWARATDQQVSRLWHRRADLCPKYGAERTMLARAADTRRKIKQVLMAAARATAAFFTGGLTGGLIP
jgi:hypothetical protein